MRRRHSLPAEVKTQRPRYFCLRELFFLPPPDFFLGTLAPDRRASDSPMAIACLRLLTLAPERPLFSLPRFISRTAFLTLRPLALPYFRATAAALALDSGLPTIDPL